MMLIAALIALQTPTLPNVQRVWKPNQKIRYQVESSVKDTVGTTLMSFRIDLASPKKIEDPAAVNIVAYYHDMDQTVGTLKNHKAGPFGNSSLLFRSVGLPEGLMLDGPIAPFLLPMMAFHLPKEVDSEGKWTLPATTIENNLVVQGSGTFKAGDRGTWLSEGAFTLSLKDKKLADVTASATFVGRDGTLQSGTGTFTSKEGTMSFTIKRR